MMLASRRVRRLALGSMIASTLVAVSPTESRANGMDAIFYVSGVAAFAWPLGTLIAGPTFFGACLPYWYRS